MNLVIQTNVPGALMIALVDTGEKVIVRRVARQQYHQSDKLLQFIDSALRQHKKTINDVRQILVVRGPGPFTAVRTGLIVGNTLALYIGIPVGGVVNEGFLTPAEIIKVFKKPPAKKFSLLWPWYGKEPNISKAKRKV